jgi:glycosyltransferase involved in cell wall biosynthesis
MRRPRVLMVTGTYHPETSGASLQCRQLVRLLHDEADFTVLTTTTSSDLPERDRVDAVDVWRVRVDPRSAASKLSAAARMTRAFAHLRRRFDIVHVHGFSQKNILVTALSRLFRKRLVIKLTSVGHDDGLTMRARGGLQLACYRQADRFIGVGPRFEEAHHAAGLPSSRFRLVPNGVDLDRFRPADAPERAAIRERHGLPIDTPLVLFVGFFSHEKRPDALYRAWADVTERGIQSVLVLIGPTASDYYEIDPRMAPAIRDDAARRGLLPRLVFVERATAIEDYYRAADVFALPTLREGMPNVVLEAMASGVPAIVTRLPGVTDWIMDETTGVLVPPDDPAALADALGGLLADAPRRQAMGRAARTSVARRFSARATAAQMVSVYRELTC